MLSKIKKFVVAASLLVSLALPIAVPVSVHAADVQQGVCSGGTNLSIPQYDSSGNVIPDKNNPADCNTAKGDTATSSVNHLITLILNILSVIVGIIAVIMIIIGGFHYVTSGGSQEKVKKAKDTLLYAIIGLIIVALAQIIVKFVLNKTIQGTQ